MDGKKRTSSPSRSKRLRAFEPRKWRVKDEEGAEVNELGSTMGQSSETGEPRKWRVKEAGLKGAEGG